MFRFTSVVRCSLADTARTRWPPSRECSKEKLEGCFWFFFSSTVAVSVFGFSASQRLVFLSRDWRNKVPHENWRLAKYFIFVPRLDVRFLTTFWSSYCSSCGHLTHFTSWCEGQRDGAMTVQDGVGLTDPEIRAKCYFHQIWNFKIQYMKFVFSFFFLRLNQGHIGRHILCVLLVKWLCGWKSACFYSLWNPTNAWSCSLHFLFFNQPVFIICNSTSSTILHLTAFSLLFVGAHKIRSSEKRQKINLSEVGTCKNGFSPVF